MSSNIPRFAAYAAAFEKSYESDDWAPLEPFFAPDAVYQVGLPQLGADRCEGRDAILAWFPDILNRFDRRFGSRELTLIDGPREQGNEVWIHGTATYRTEGFPDFHLTLEETVRFDGEQIIYLADAYTPEMAVEIERYLTEYGAKLGIELTLEG